MKQTVKPVRERKNISVFLFARNYLSSWGSNYDAEDQYRHIESTRKTRASLLKEISLLCSWQEKGLKRTRQAMEIIIKLSSGKDVDSEEIINCLEGMTNL